MSQVFLSYSSTDRAAVEPVRAALVRAGLEVETPEDVAAGAAFAKEIESKLDSARCVIVVWSKAAAESQWVQAEIRWGIRAWSSNRLLLAVVDDAPMPVGLRDIPRTPIGGATDAGATQLVERAKATVAAAALRDLRVRPEGLAPPAPPPPANSPRSAQPEVLQRAAPFHVGRWVIGGGLAAAALAAAAAVLLSLNRASAPVPKGRPENVPTLPLPRPPSPFEPTAADTVGWLPIVLGAIVVGAAFGAAAVWAWSAWSSRRKQRPVAIASAREPITNGKPRVFVSYSHKDVKVVDRLVQQIEGMGFPVWIDREAGGPQRYAGAIVGALRASRLVALMCSQNAFASDQVIREVYVAGDFKKPFIAFQLDLADFPDDVLYFVSGFPRVPIASVNPQQLRSEIARLVA